MSRHLIRDTSEADWTGHERCWAWVEVYPARNRILPLLKVGAVFVFGAVAMAVVVVFLAASV